jgi:hypothetical protein
MSDGLHWAEMPRLDAFDEEFGQDPVAIQRGRRRRIVRRLWAFVAIVLGAGVIAALAFVWSTADGRLRLELQSALPPSPRGASREASDEELDDLRRQVDALRNEIGELTRAQQQAAATIAALQAAEQEARSRVPPPAYWYSNPATLDLSIASQPPPGVVLPPRRPTTARRESRGVRRRERSAAAVPAPSRKETRAS